MSSLPSPLQINEPALPAASRNSCRPALAPPQGRHWKAGEIPRTVDGPKSPSPSKGKRRPADSSQPQVSDRKKHWKVREFPGPAPARRGPRSSTSRRTWTTERRPRRGRAPSPRRSPTASAPRTGEGRYRSLRFSRSRLSTIPKRAPT